jgi:hypothetical protein
MTAAAGATPVPAAGDVDPAPAPAESRASGERAWLLALLPAFPLLLLVLRVWYLARQDLQTMLMVLQSANPLGLIASLLISLIWAIPLLVLLFRVHYLLLLVSLAQEGERPTRSWLARQGNRMPTWVSAPSVVLAALSWQLRFLPSLLMLALVILALEVRNRLEKPDQPRRFLTSATSTAVPIAVGLLTLAWFGPAIVHALGSSHEPVTALLLLLPPLATPLICGPIPPATARWLLPASASLLALTIPFLLGANYLSTPVLPRVAVQFRPAKTTAVSTPSAGRPTPAGEVLVQRGSLVSVDDRFTTVLDAAGQVHFIPGNDVTDQVLCSTGPEPPDSTVSVHGWQVEQSVLSWAAPRPRQTLPDARCSGD